MAELPNAKNQVGIAITTISIEKTRLGPNLSSAIPTTTRPGMVKATLAIKNSLM